MQDKIAWLFTAEKIRLVSFFSLLLTAAVMDLKTRIIPDQIWIAIVGISFLPLEFVRIPGVFIGIPLLAVGVMEGGIGGADIKIAAACGLVLGLERGILGMCFSYILLLVFHLGKKVVEQIMGKKREEQAYPLVPFLFLGMGMSQWMTVH